MSQQADLQTIIYNARILESYLSELSVREATLSRLLLEYRSALEAVESISEDEESECMLPIGGGVSVPVRLRGGFKYLVSIGAGVFLEKGKSDTVLYLNKKIQELEQALKTVIAQKQQVEEQLAKLQAEIQKAVTVAQSESRRQAPS